MAHKVSEQWFFNDRTKAKYRFFFNYQVTFYGDEFRDEFKGKVVCDMSKRCLWESEHNDRSRFIKEFLEFFAKYRLSGSQHSIKVMNIYCKGVKKV